LIHVSSIDDIVNLKLQSDLRNIDFEKEYNDKIKCVIVTTEDNDGKYDFISRYFAPWWGVPEDPVCGSAHTVLAVFWSRLLNNKLILRAFQKSERGGELEVELAENGQRVLLRGRAITILEGQLFISKEDFIETPKSI